MCVCESLFVCELVLMCAAQWELPKLTRVYAMNPYAGESERDTEERRGVSR